MAQLRVFAISILITIASLIAAFVYDSWQGVTLCLILGILEVSLSFDNAVINATVLARMSEFWQRIFLTVGVIIAVFGMRLVFPLVIIWITAHRNPIDAFRLAMNPPAHGAEHFADGSPSYELLLKEAHPQIAAFGGMFLLMLFLNFVLSDHDVKWLAWVERPLARIGRLEQLPVIVAGGTLVLVAEYLVTDAHRATILIAGILGIITYITVDGLGRLFHVDEEGDGPSPAVAATGKAAFFLFVYLEVLDASFSFDGVIGAFAITADPIIIALGLGFIGSMFVRSITVYLVRQGTLADYRYLEHGAYWAIGALAVIMVVSINPDYEVDEVVTGLIGVVFIGAAFISSIVANRRDRREITSAPAAR